jgi:AraC-like DNA-binding protein
VTVAQFFTLPEVVAVIEQARTASSMPVSVHLHDRAGEAQHMIGRGACAACHAAASTESGRAACKDSRANAAGQALRGHRVAPFVCHLGLSCVAAPAVKDSGANAAITFGPFCPAEAPHGLGAAVADGLLVLGHDSPVTTDDIAKVSADGVPVMVEWTVDRLTALWHAHDYAPEPETEPDPEPEPKPKPAPPLKARVRLAGPAPVMVVALAAGDRAWARWALRNALDEAAAAGESVNARAVSLVTQILEAADRANLPTDIAWQRFEAFVPNARKPVDIATLSRASMRVISPIAKTFDGRTADKLGVVFREVVAWYGEGIRIEDVAAKTQSHPTTITHLLQRRFGLSFSELAGKIRIERAKKALRDTQLTVGEIARRVGISDVSNFGRLFRRFEGHSPQTYRDKFRKAA